ncbi:MAG: ABC transporter permease [Coriobacteriia bacterium]|nr:ABC transporter permease [Coriobacteriia bacterium]
MMRALLAEIVKLRRSNYTLIALAVVTIAPALASVIVASLLDPNQAESLGLTPEAAAQIGEPGWPLIFTSVADLVGTGLGTIMFSIMAASLFVREHQSGTMKMMLTVPVTRASIVVAKLVALAGWIGLILVYLIGASLVAGILGGLDAPLPAEMLSGILLLIRVTVLIYLSLGVVCFLASLGKGYLLPMGFAGAMLAIAVIFANNPAAAYVPWVMPAIEATSSTGDVGPLSAIHWVIAVAVFVASGVATWIRLRFSDAPR